MPESIQIHPKAQAPATAGALRVALLYAGFSALFILLSDPVVGAFIHDPAAMTLASIVKGWIFVAVTAILLFVMVKRLVLEQERLQAQLHQAQKMELVGRFAGGVAHDYNNMLTVIRANAELALGQLPPEHSERKHLEEILRAANHSADLTRQLLAFARQQPMNPCLVDLNEAVGAMQGLLGRLVAPRIQLVWALGEGLWRTRMDPTQLDQVLTNLTVNARDAIAGPGRIEVATANRTLTAADCAAGLDAVPGDHICLSVTDSGCGMTPEQAAQIFEPFFTTKPAGQGTGLGLAMVHSVVKQHQGAIQVDSQPGRGTCFRIFFPRA
jgi:signal transduction histidine kinase